MAREMLNRNADDDQAVLSDDEPYES